MKLYLTTSPIKRTLGDTMNNLVMTVLTVAITAVLAVIPWSVILFAWTLLKAKAKLSKRMENIIAIAAYIISFLLVMSIYEW